MILVLSLKKGCNIDLTFADEIAQVSLKKLRNVVLTLRKSNYPT